MHEHDTYNSDQAASDKRPITEPDDEQPDEAELRRRYIEQLRRLSCPDCGEEPFVD